jgi:hypothetical protein
MKTRKVLFEWTLGAYAAAFGVMFASVYETRTGKGIWEKAEDFVQDRIDELKDLVAKLKGKVDKSLGGLSVALQTSALTTEQIGKL